MPFRKSSSSPADALPFDVTSTEEDGFEVIHDRRANYVGLHGFEVFVGLSHQGDLDDSQLQFANHILKRAEVTKTAFFARFTPLGLAELNLASKDPAFQDMCSRGIELLDVAPGLDDGDIALAARRAADAAEAFLATPAARNPQFPQLRKFGLEVRLRARETMQERIERKPENVNPSIAFTSRSDEAVILMRDRARLMAEYLGVHRSSLVRGVDFILDAHGKVAFAFKPMSAWAAVEAVCMARLHGALFRAMGSPTHASTAMIVSMPARGGATAEPGRPAHGTDDADDVDDVDDVDEVLGLLMIPPPGFDLCLACPREGRVSGRQRLVDALARPLNNDAFDHLALSTLCAKGLRLRLDEVLVDDGGRAWVLDHESLLAYHPSDRVSPSNGPGQGGASSAAGRIPTDMPMSPDRLRALGQLDLPQLIQHLDANWRATDRERRLLGEAIGKTSQADIAATDELWPDKDALTLAKKRLEDVQIWADSCANSNDQLLDTKNPTEILDPSDALSRQPSIRWLLSTYAGSMETADREMARALELMRVDG